MEGQDASAFDLLRSRDLAKASLECSGYAGSSCIAHFIEVRIQRHTQWIRVRRVLRVADRDRIISLPTVTSRVRGGAEMTIGSALRMQTRVDPLSGGWLNAERADRVLPVDVDIKGIDMEFLDRPNSLGIRHRLERTG